MLLAVSKVKLRHLRILLFYVIKDSKTLKIDEEEMNMRNEVLDNLGEKINEIIEWINTQEDFETED